MKRRILLLAVAATSMFAVQGSVASAADQQALVVVDKRTIIAFFSVAKVQLQHDADANEALTDFQLYVRQADKPLKQMGIELRELYTGSFRVRVGKAVSRFRAGKGNVGYYLIVPGKKPRVEYGVMTDADLLRVATEYFGEPTK